MPTKSEIGKTYILHPSIPGEWTEMSTVSIPPTDRSEMIEASTIGNSIPIDLECDIQYKDGLNARDFWLVLIGFCTVEQVKQNNWRKMHGLPMKRR